MSDRFPYDLPSREALCVEIRKISPYELIEDKYVTFEDMVFSPTQLLPGRTFIEMVNLTNSVKSWFVYRRLDLSIALGKDLYISLVGDVSPKLIAEEINRSRNMVLGPDDISFSEDLIEVQGGKLVYELRAMNGSYAYYGECTVHIDVFLSDQGVPRLEQDGDYRLLEDGSLRLME